MDNQQVDPSLTWLACLIDSEGYITATWNGFRGDTSHSKHVYYKRIKPQVAFVNTNRNLMNAAANILRRCRIPFWVYSQKPHKGHKPIVKIEFNGYTRSRKILDLLMPYLIGKRHEAVLLDELLKSRVGKRGGIPYSAREREIVDLLRKAKDEVHLRDLEPDGGFLGPLEDIVHPLGKS